MELLPYIDIHVHNFYNTPGVVILQNMFPEDLDKAEDETFYSAGLHPWFIQKDNWMKQMGQLSQFYEKDNVLAVGETGLDVNRPVSIELQKEVFQAHLEISEDINKPVIIHCVRAYNDLIVMRKKSNTKIPWVVHWFNASYEIAMELIQLNCYLSYGKSLYNPSCKAYKFFPEIQEQRIFFETDDTGYSIEEIYQKAAELRKVSITYLKKRVIRNFENCFKQ